MEATSCTRQGSSPPEGEEKHTPGARVRIKDSGETGTIKSRARAPDQCFWIEINWQAPWRLLHVSEIELCEERNALFENSQTTRESTPKKEEGRYTITVILRQLPGHSEPFVTHIHTLEDDGYISGHYFETLKDAVQDYYERCEEEKVNPDPSPFSKEVKEND